MHQHFEISAEDGYIGLVNTDLYHSFIDDNWEEFDDLKQRLLSESKKGHILFWGTDIPGIWTVRICDKPMAPNAFKSFDAKIKINNATLHLTNYESIAFAAQYEEEKLPSEDLEDLHVILDNGIYNVTVRQLFDPEKDPIEDGKLGFELVLNKIAPYHEKNINNHKALFWSEY